MSKVKITKNLNSVSALAENGFISKQEISALETVAQQFSVAITPQMADLLSDTNPNDPINLQFVPDLKELDIKIHQLKDPIGDEIHSPVPGIVHRHPDRCLLKPIHTCPVYCRFCFRREQIGHQAKILSEADLENAYQYIASKPEIWEVILTGGDPLMLTPAKLASILTRLNAIQTVEVIRIHTRIPIVDSKRINDAMLNALAIDKALFIALHANHPKEFTSEAENAIRRIVCAGIPMISQSVLLKGINDDPKILQALFKKFVTNRIKPYYLHHCDLAIGTEHFRTSIEEGQNLMRDLRKNVSGLCQPTYVLDIPGGYGKVPLHPNYIKPTEKGYDVEDCLGVQHVYHIP